MPSKYVKFRNLGPFQNKIKKNLNCPLKMIILPKNCIKTGWKISKWKVKFWNSAIVGPFQLNLSLLVLLAGADPGFSALKKKLRRAEGGAKMFGLFRVKNHDLTPKNNIFWNCGGRCENFWGISCEKSRFTPTNHIFSNFRVCVPPPLDPPLTSNVFLPYWYENMYQYSWA